MMLTTPEERQMGMFLHLSQLANIVLPPAGLVLPIVLWQVKKDEMPGLDRHGKMVVNWMISSLIYFFVSGILVFVIVGFFLRLALALLSVIFPIVGAVKANNGELWEYPLTIKFLK
ncbi:MAG: DUF4870 domain-containing protein [Acidobacteria bacterium]|nr:DUF4870 domain-containing protein [Acidobacteriota bacterium]